MEKEKSYFKSFDKLGKEGRDEGDLYFNWGQLRLHTGVCRVCLTMLYVSLIL